MSTKEELKARISSLEIQLARSKREIEQQCEEFLSKGAKATNMLCDADARIAEQERDALREQVRVLSEALKQLASDKWNNQHWARGIAFEALTAVKPAGQKGSE
jgi:hypothetical protein